MSGADDRDQLPVHSGGCWCCPAFSGAPLTNLEEMSAQLAEMFDAYVKAGIPARHVAVMLGTWMGTLGSGGATGGDGS